MRMEINELDLSIIISHDRMHICKTSIETDGDFKIFLIKDCDRIKDIRGFDAASDHETSKYQQADKMTIDRAIEDASCQVDYISSQLDNLDMTVLEESKSVSKNICDVMESIDCIRYEIQRLHEDILIVTGNRYKLITFALDDINKSIGTFYENLIEGGECYLSYPGDSTSLFAEGIQFIARYEDRCWTDIKKLSGGQQAACGFAVRIFKMLII